MNIVLCANTSWYVYNFRRNLIAALRQQGHKVGVIAPYDDYTAKLDQLGVSWWPLPLQQTGTNPVQELRTLMNLGRLLSRLQPQVVLSFTIKCNLYVGLLRRCAAFRQIANISGLGEVFDRRSVFTRGVLGLYTLALRRAQKVFFQNQEDLQMFRGRHLLPAPICARLPGSGVDLMTFRPAVPDIRPSGPRVFLMFGRLVPQKGYDLFLQAAQRLRQSPSACSAEFWVLGLPDESRPAAAQLQQRIRAWHQRGVIRSLAPTARVAPIIHQADVVVLPSVYHEGVPRSLLEALACAKPILTTNWKGCRDTVEHGVNGYLMTPGDLADLEHYLRVLMRVDRSTLQQMGRASRQKAEREFDERVVIARYLAEIGGDEGVKQ
jgi:glycosyltransferase involved in cell wall biosynthesis